MNKKSSNTLFLIVLTFLILTIAFLRHPDVKAQYSTWYRTKLFTEFQTQLKTNGLDPEVYWQFRERFSPGAFTREEKNTDFFTTFRITSLEEESTPLLFYTSEYLTSMDGLLLGDTRVRLNEFKAASTGEILLESDSFILTKINQSQYLFVFITSTEEMQRVNGMFDYTSKERELIKNQQWYNVTQLTL